MEWLFEVEYEKEAKREVNNLVALPISGIS